ncbi:GrpB family protein [Paenibacillus sp. MWE-103]|uniref:GrpB family protein n=1 Tax=Paenibacillus artemisiicola TaxID=1172618 RepID=A0ABS3W4L9_9BACL|nr:GrpB family protein [Paenibacillus artemisiicola]MBO7743234.1 GrpB family protein [Paenibacillus artemisiicola]
MRESVVIVPFDANWRSEFADIGANLRRALADRAVRIDHIGSTSIAGLDAKPVIDVQVSVRGLTDLEAISDALTGLGYVLRADNPDLTKRYYRESEGMRRTHIHVREHGSFSEQLSLLFRDYVRAHAHEAKRYAAIKHSLAKSHRHERDRYVEEKEPYIWDMLRSASKWSQQTGWRPGASDM